MTATNHALTGAALATVVKQPFLALPLAFLSHLICDALPHFGINMKFGSRAMYTWLGLDGLTLLGLAILLLILNVKQPIWLAFAGFVAMSPDLAWYWYGKQGVLNEPKRFDWLSRLHSKIQWYQRVPGIMVEIVWATSMVLVILRLQ